MHIPAPTTSPEVSRTAPFAVCLTGRPFLVEWCEDTYELRIVPRYPNEPDRANVYSVLVSDADPYTVHKLGHRGLRDAAGRTVLGSILLERGGQWSATTYKRELWNGAGYTTAHLQVARLSKPKRSRPAAVRALLDMLEGWAA